MWTFIRLRNGISVHMENMKGKAYWVFTDEHSYSWDCTGEGQEKMPLWEEQWLPHHQETGRSRTTWWYLFMQLWITGSLLLFLQSENSHGEGQVSMAAPPEVSLLRRNVIRLLSTSVESQVLSVIVTFMPVLGSHEVPQIPSLNRKTQTNKKTPLEFVLPMRFAY